MAYWAGFYERIFNFREIRYFDIKGEYTGLTSRAMTAPDGKIRIPLNEEASKSTGQIEEFLMKYNGEGIQHIALLTDDLAARASTACAAAGVPLMTAPPATYYEMLDERLPGHGENVERTAGARHPARRHDRGRQAAPAAADLLADAAWARCSSSSSSARATTASAKATSRRCSSRSNATSCAAA